MTRHPIPLFLLLLSPALCSARDPMCLQDLLAASAPAETAFLGDAAEGAPAVPARLFDVHDVHAAGPRREGEEPPAKPAHELGVDPGVSGRGRPGTERNLVRNLVYDQKQIWTSPFRLKGSDARWLVPFAGIAGGLIASDARAMQLEQSRPVDISRSNNVADGGVAALGATALGLYAWGRFNHDAHAREAGILTGEAMADSMVVVEALKFATQRQRPDIGNGRGQFFTSGNSFPSGHTIAVWSAASVIAHEYPGWLTQLAVYGTAAAVSIARVSGRQHFPSDVAVAAPLGWLIGRQVYRAHHNPDLDGASIGTFSRGDRPRPRALASTYVPLDSWVYPALARLAAMGFINTQIAGLQPWTRLECERQVQEARTTLNALDDEPAGVRSAIAQLEREFAAEKEAAQGEEDFQDLTLESVYFRYTNISGTPLRDSFHFGQTSVNDFGRPFGEGGNVVTGVSGRAVDGRFSFYFRGEYQHAPGAPALPLDVRQFIATKDQVPLPGAHPFATIDRFRLLEGYMGVTVGDFNVTFGKQNLWWGPGRGGALILSNNAEPMYMLRISNMHPFRLPGVLKYMGDIRVESFMGKLEGHSKNPCLPISKGVCSPARPYEYGNKITFKPTPNLEFGFSRTDTFAGAGHDSPFTLGTFGLAFFSVGDQPAADHPGRDPGDRHGQFDFSYRVPRLRNWLTVYSDSYVDDDPTPLAAPRRAAFNPGFYLSHFPGLARLDLRAESVYTDLPAVNGHGTFIYWNTVYHNGYTSNGNLVGSWIGRQGKGFQVWTTYWHSAQSTVQVGWRNAKISTDFVPGGGTQNDIFANANLFVRPELSISATVQREAWLIPLLKPGLQHDWSASFQVTVFPKLKKGHGRDAARSDKTP